MVLERKDLEAMKFPDLKRLASEMGANPQPSETKEILIDRLLLLAAQEPLPKEPEQAKETTKPVSESCTIEQVKEAVGPFILRGMKVFYDKESNSWLFRVQIKSYTVRDTNSGEVRVMERWRDDSGTLNQPLSTIKRCASILMQNALQPAQVAKPFNPAERYEAIA